MIKKVNHLAVVVPDLNKAISFWVDTLGLSLDHVEDVPTEKVNVAFLNVGESHLELLQPTDEESGVARFLQKRGAGIHHICFEVENIVEALAELKAKQVPLITEEVMVGSDGRRYAFVHPKGTGGVLVELYELPPSHLTVAQEARQRLSQLSNEVDLIDEHQATRLEHHQ